MEEKIIYKDTWNNTTINMEVEEKDLQAVTKTKNLCIRKDLQQSNPENYYTLRVTKEQRIPTFNTTALHYKVDVTNLDVRDLPDIVKTFPFSIYNK